MIQPIKALKIDCASRQSSRTRLHTSPKDMGFPKRRLATLSISMALLVEPATRRWVDTMTDEPKNDPAAGTTDQKPRWEGPPENRPRGYLPAKDDPNKDRDAVGENNEDPDRNSVSGIERKADK
jgi:hypothetical protein